MSAPRSDLNPVDTIPELALLTARLAQAGGRAWLAGPALLRWVEGRPAAPLTLWTTASHADIARAFPRAVPIPGSAEAGRIGAWRVATGLRPTFLRPIGPAQHREATRALDAVLAQMPFGALAVAVCIETGEWRDPNGGRADLDARRLRLLDTPKAAVERDPLLVLRAAWLSARHGLVMDENEARSVEVACGALDRVPPAHLTSMLLGTLGAPHADAGSRLLDQAGLARAWLGAAATRAVAGLDALPHDPAIRLLAFGRGAKPGFILRRVRLDRGTRARFVALAEHHPIDVRQPNPRPRALRRLIERLGRCDIDALIALRRAELVEPTAEASASDRERALAQIEAIGAALALFDRGAAPKPALAVRGGELISALALPAGPAIGRLLASLERAVLDGRVENETHALIAFARALHDGASSSPATPSNDS